MVYEQYMIVSVAVLELPFGRLILHLLTCISLVFVNNFIMCIIIAAEAVTTSVSCVRLLIIVVAMVDAIVFDIFIDVGVIGVRREDLRVGGF